MLGREISNPEEKRSIESVAKHTDGGASVLTVRDLYADKKLYGIDLDIAAGEIHGLAGLLGSGRSETVKSIYGDLQSESSKLMVKGKSIKRNSIPAALKAGIALLSEDRKAEGIIPDLSVRDN